ncbi:MAG: 3-phosphoshikimate 1-carboxyvinyltransferase [Varibaculum cambriense]|uniref:3-phosphoshikimate 1-carboxyvinyltransferase n=1 Tax=Varibaculum cambriense TaxID=184870 RepID=UPI00290906E8|nr:3-phosphoshikimate 1-carboxyvinyltransferase [Varibaculum cambriense]MDU6681018.1 3-phosphoshikimate 1-carboxyvinyltransferase [Varibaculum cambriense]
MSVWNAPVKSTPLNAVISLPPSKSLTARALVLALLAEEPTLLTNPLRCRDTELMIAGIQEFGAQVDEQAGGLLITPPAKLTPQTGIIECGLAGTVMRFLTPVALLSGRPVRFQGDEAAGARPMKGLLDALTKLGAQFSDIPKPGHLPFTISGQLNASEQLQQLQVDASSSSQFVSALLLISPALPFELQIEVDSVLPSIRHVEMTVAEVNACGGQIENLGGETGDWNTRQIRHLWRCRPACLRGGERHIEPDLTNAGPFLAAAMICGGQVSIPHWPAKTFQAGDAWRQLLTPMGARIYRSPEGSLVCQGNGVIGGTQCDLEAIGELTPTLAALCTLAVEPSKLTGIGHLRGHETDRLTALETEIKRLGGKAKASETTLRISPSPLHGDLVQTYADHRMAMFAALIGLQVPGVRIADIKCVAKTFPDFTATWETMLAGANGSA